MRRYPLAGAALALLWCTPSAAQVTSRSIERAALQARLRQLEREELAEDIARKQAQLAALDAAIAAPPPTHLGSDPGAGRGAATLRAATGPAVVTSADPGADPAMQVRTTPENAGANGQPKAGNGDATRPFAGLKFGAGVSVTKDLGKRDRIGDARLDTNKLVRVYDRNNVPARLMIESHYFFTPCHGFLGIRYNKCEVTKDDSGKTWREAVKGEDRWGWGPFVALQPGGDDVIDAIGLGLMVGFRRNQQTNESFNFGFGYVVDPNTKVLGRDVRENQPLPAGETEVRLEDTTQTGLLFLASFSF